MVVAGANRNDFKLMAETLLSLPIRRPLATDRNPQHLCLDKGYDYPEVEEIAELLCYMAHIRPRGEESVACQRGKKARRWVVERTHSWFNRFRRILVRWEKKVENYLAFLHLACALITFRAAASA